MKPEMVAHYEVDMTAHDPEQSPFARTSCCRTTTAFAPCTRASSPHTNMSAKSGRRPEATKCRFKPRYCLGGEWITRCHFAVGTFERSSPISLIQHRYH